MSLTGIARKTVSRTLKKFKEEKEEDVASALVAISIYNDMERLKGKLLQDSD